jgi:hypothetical protein
MIEAVSSSETSGRIYRCSIQNATPTTTVFVSCGDKIKLFFIIWKEEFNRTTLQQMLKTFTNLKRSVH